MGNRRNMRRSLFYYADGSAHQENVAHEMAGTSKLSQKKEKKNLRSTFKHHLDAAEVSGLQLWRGGPWARN